MRTLDHFFASILYGKLKRLKSAENFNVFFAMVELESYVKMQNIKYFNHVQVANIGRIVQKFLIWIRNPCGSCVRRGVCSLVVLQEPGCRGGQPQHLPACRSWRCRRQCCPEVALTFIYLWFLVNVVKPEPLPQGADICFGVGAGAVKLFRRRLQVKHGTFMS